MGSLMQLLFDTMPLAGARYAVTSGKPASLTNHTIDELRVHVTAADASDASQFNVNLPPLTEDQQKLPLATRPVWSFEAAESLTTITNVECRSVSETFRSVRVLESVSFGSEAASGEFQETVEVYVGAQWQSLRLSADALVASFKTRGGRGGENCPSPWPLEAEYEHGVLHVYLYEVDPDSYEIRSAASIVDQELDVFRANVTRLTRTAAWVEEKASKSHASISELLTDNAWTGERVSGVTASVPGGEPAQSSTSVAGTDGSGTISGTFEPEPQITDVRAVPHRILVCTFLCLTHEGDDYTPGRPAWGVRMYPVIMVRSTKRLNGLRAGVHLVRPQKTTIDGSTGAECACHEMKPEMSSLLVSDTNAGDFPDTNWMFFPFSLLPLGLVSHNSRVPVPFWNSIFAYYVTHAAKTFGSSRIKVVDKSKGAARTIPGALTRLGTDGKLHRRPRQGAFDNVHIAPPMKMPTVAGVYPQGYTQVGLLGAGFGTWEPIAEDDRAKWGFDEVVMAPICAHDCFHMHWRWGDAEFVGADDRSAHGFATMPTGEFQPYVIKGGPLIAANQDLFIRLPDPRSIVYEAEVKPVAADQWAIICHHGAGYVTKTGLLVDSGRLGQDAMASGGLAPTFTSEKPILLDVPIVDLWPDRLTAIDSWAVFYWRNRYYIPDYEGAGPTERVTIIDMDLVLHEKSELGSRPGRH